LRRRFFFRLALRIALAFAIRRCSLLDTNQRFLRATCTSHLHHLSAVPWLVYSKTKTRPVFPRQGDIAERSSRVLTIRQPRLRLTITRFRSEHSGSLSGQRRPGERLSATSVIYLQITRTPSATIAPSGSAAPSPMKARLHSNPAYSPSGARSSEGAGQPLANTRRPPHETAEEGHGG
jgi:hypothetical protein